MSELKVKDLIKQLQLVNPERELNFMIGSGLDDHMDIENLGMDFNIHDGGDDLHTAVDLFLWVQDSSWGSGKQKWLNLEHGDDGDMEKKYEELCEMIRGDSPNWTHEETVERCSEQVDALHFVENEVDYKEYGAWLKKEDE